MSHIDTISPSDKQKLGPLIAAVLLAATPHMQNLEPPIMGYFGLLVVWRIYGLFLRPSPPRGILLFFLTLGGVWIVLGQYNRFWGLEAGSSLLVVGLGLKLLELRTQRDAYLVVFLTFFVSLTLYLFSQDITMAAYTLGVVILLVVSLIGLNSTEVFPLRARFKMAGIMVAQAIPVMIMMFLLFPRIQGPLWQLPEENPGAKTGLSDSLSPGTISHLALSQETAFRVNFEREPPPPSLRYWRGPVFWKTDGVNWKPSSTLSTSKKPKRRGIDGIYHYTLTLEPHNRRWIYALDLPVSIPPDIKLSADYQLLSWEDIADRKQFQLASATVYHTGPLSEEESRMGLQLPPTRSARVEELARKWKNENPDPKQFAERVLRHFREENFYYTLNPPLADGDPVESFLLRTRRGFCEHYAVAFVTLMRLGQVPARVVTGYQGGQWNRVGRFLDVKQADAHAWAEIWLEESGWTRVDPTAAVAPDRIEYGLDMESSIRFGALSFNFGQAGTEGKGFAVGSLWRELRMVAASVDHAWNSWVLSYGPETQDRLRKWLGAVDWRALAGWLSAGIALMLGLAAWMILPNRGRHNDPAKRLYRKFLDAFQKRGITLRTGETPLMFADRAADSAPELADMVQLITGLYLRIRYERTHSPNDLKRMHRSIQALSQAGNRLAWRRTGGD